MASRRGGGELPLQVCVYRGRMRVCLALRSYGADYRIHRVTILTAGTFFSGIIGTVLDGALGTGIFFETVTQTIPEPEA